MNQKNNSGFTLIELLVVIAITAALATVSFISVGNYGVSNSLQRTGESVVEALRNTRQRSISQENGLRWGMRFSNATSGQTYTSFGGASYASSTSKNTYALKNGIFFGNPPASSSLEVLFNPVTGFSAISQTITLIDGRKDGLVYEIAVNRLGNVIGKFWQGLVGYWPMDEGTGTVVYDASGYGGSGTLINGPLWQTGSNCKAGNCLKFYSSANPVNVLTSGVSPHTSLTLTAWINPTTYPTERSTIILGWGGYYLSLYSDGSVQTYWYGKTPSGYFSSGSGTVPLNSWSFVAAVWESSSVSLYVNGLLKSATSTTGSGNSSTATNIGAESTARQFIGSIDDVRIYNRALSAEEVQDLFIEAQ